MKKKKYSSVGRSINRVDAVEKVTGSAVYTDDLVFPGMLYADVLRSEIVCGKVKDIDLEKAKGLKGVRAVMTYRDIPGKNIVPVVVDDMPVLVEKDIRFHKEAIVIIAGESPEVVKKAKDLIKIEYEETKPILSIEDSLRVKRTVNKGFKDNIFAEYNIKRGRDVFKKADLIVENTYFTDHQEHAYLEPQSVIVKPMQNNSFKVYGSFQCPYYVKYGVSAVLGIDIGRIIVEVMTTGGGFGGKEDMPSINAEIAALLAAKTKRPVKFIMSRSDDIMTMSKRHPSMTKYRSAFSSDGRLLGVKVEYFLNGGAYSTLSPVVLWRGVVHAAGPYSMEYVNIIGKAYATNTLPCGAFRGFGTPQIIYAAESQMDIAAEKLGMDPLKIRIKNALKSGDKTATGQILKSSVGIHKTISAAKNDFKWEKHKKHIEDFNRSHKDVKRGIGMSCLFYGVGLGARGGPLQRGEAMVSLFKDGSVQISVGTTEMGQGMFTVLTQIASERLGISADRINLLSVSSDRANDSGPTVASRATFISGNAVIMAIDRIRSNLESFIRSELKIEKNTKICYFKDEITLNGKKLMDFKELALKAYLNRVKMTETAMYIPPETDFNMETGQGNAYFVYSYVTNMCLVEVNLTTYMTKVIKYLSAEEFGTTINPILAEGQIEGGSLQGIGFALYENLVIEKGKVLANDLSTYLIPTIKDVDEIKACITETYYKEGPYGAKGMGEMPLMGAAPCVANAIHSAIGYRFFKIPVLPQDVYEKCRN